MSTFPNPMTDSKPIRVAGVQMNVDFADNASNLGRMQASLKEAAGAGATLVIFPECALSGCCYESLEEAMSTASTTDARKCTEPRIERRKGLNHGLHGRHG